MADGKSFQWLMVEPTQILPPFRLGSAETPAISQGAIRESSWNMASRIISERSFEFACRTVKLCETLWTRGPACRKIADQLFDSGTSIGANAAAAEGAQTKPDFLAKLAISPTESWETIYWLRLAIATSVCSKEAVAWELDEAQQLKAMITQAIKTGQASHWRGGS
jgi:four helix bundle protein